MTAKGKTSRGALRIRQIKSSIGYHDSQRRTLRALGLAKIGRSRTVPDSPQVRGMIAKVSHLVEVEKAEA